MIIWDTFSQYFLNTAQTYKIIVVVVIAVAILLQRTAMVQKSYEWISKQDTRKLLWVILIIAFILRIVWVLWSPQTDPSAGTEDTKILKHATDLAAGNGYIDKQGNPIARRPFAYPLFLAFLFKLFGKQIWLVEMLQVFFGVISVALVFWIGRLVANRHIALFAAFLLTLLASRLIFLFG